MDGARRDFELTFAAYLSEASIGDDECRVFNGRAAITDDQARPFENRHPAGGRLTGEIPGPSSTQKKKCGRDRMGKSFLYLSHKTLRGN